MTTEPDNLVLHLLREMRGEMTTMRDEMATKADVADMRSEVADVRSEVRSLRADVASDMVLLEKRLGGQIVGLRRAVVEYHSSVIGHGILITELDGRVARIERHLGLATEAPVK
jgi:hypothetical protein